MHFNLVTFLVVCILQILCQYCVQFEIIFVFNIFAETMDHDPLRRDLAQEEALENIIADGDPPESPSSYLNPSGDGMEVERDYPLQGKMRTEVEDGSDYGDGDDGEDGSSDDGEDGSSDDGEAGGQLTKSGEVYIDEVVICGKILEGLYIFELYTYKLTTVFFS